MANERHHAKFNANRGSVKPLPRYGRLSMFQDGQVSCTERTEQNNNLR